MATLRIDRARGDPAPHKPLLLLVLLEMADKGEITGCEIALSADIAFRFSVFWSIVAQRRRQRPEVRLPFHHLRSSGLWEPLTAEGKPSPNRMLTTTLRLDASFFTCLTDQEFRDQAKRVLIETEPYFRPEERVALYSMLNIRPNVPEIRDDTREYRTRVQSGRNARFRIEVVVCEGKEKGIILVVSCQSCDTEMPDVLRHPEKYRRPAFAGDEVLDNYEMVKINILPVSLS